MIEEIYDKVYGEGRPINDDRISTAVEKFVASYCIISAKEADVARRNIRKSEELAYIDEIIQSCIKYNKTYFVLSNPSENAIGVLRDKGYRVTKIEKSDYLWDDFYTVSFS